MAACSGAMNLSLASYGAASEDYFFLSLPYSVGAGLTGTFGWLPLAVLGPADASLSGSMNLSARGPSVAPHSGSMNLSAFGANATSEASLNLFACNSGIWASLPLFAWSKGEIDGAIPASGWMNLSMRRAPAEWLPLFARGPGDLLSGVLPLYTHGSIIESDWIPMYASGVGTAQAALKLMTWAFG